MMAVHHSRRCDDDAAVADADADGSRYTGRHSVAAVGGGLAHVAHPLMRVVHSSGPGLSKEHQIFF